MPQREPGDSSYRDSQEGSQSEGATILYHQSPQTSLPSQTATRSPMPPVNSPRTSELGPSLSPYSQHYSIREWQRGASGEPPRTVYTVPHYCIGDDHPSLQSNPKVPDRHSQILEGIFDVFNYFGSKQATMNPQAARNTISESFAKWNHELALQRAADIQHGTLSSDAEVIEVRLADANEDGDPPSGTYQMSLEGNASLGPYGPPKIGDHEQSVLQQSVAEIVVNKPPFRSISPEVQDPSWAGSGVLDAWNDLGERHLEQVSLAQEQ
jgi:hypothetical protein